MVPPDPMAISDWSSCQFAPSGALVGARNYMNRTRRYPDERIRPAAVGASTKTVANR